MKKQQEKQQQAYGVNVALPNTVEEKMKAITNLSEAIVQLSIAINSVNVEVTVSNNVITGASTGIQIQTEQ